LVICMAIQTNLNGQAVQGAWQYDIQTNLMGREVKGGMAISQTRQKMPFPRQHFSCTSNGLGG